MWIIVAAVRVDGTVAARARGQEELGILAHRPQLDGEAHVRGRTEARARQHAADGQLALRRRPDDRFDVALDDARRVGLERNLRLVARLDLAHLVLPEVGHDPLLVLDERHRRDGRERHDHHAGPQGQRDDVAIGRGDGHGLLEIPRRVGQLRLGLRDLRQDLRDLVLHAGRRLRRQPLLHLCHRGLGSLQVVLRPLQVGLRLVEIEAVAGAGSDEFLELAARWRASASCVRAVPWRLTASFNCCDRLRWLAVAEISCALSDSMFASAERTWISNGVRVEPEQHVALLDRNVRLDRHLDDLAGDARIDRYHVVHDAHVGGRRREDVQEQDQHRDADDRDRRGDHLARDVPRQPLELDEDQPDEERVDAEQEDFHQPRASRPSRASSDASCARSCSISSRAASGFAAAAGASDGLAVVTFSDVRAVGHLVEHRLRIGPQPRQRPEHAAEHQRQQAQHLDRLRLRVLSLLGDLLREDVHQPEHGQHDERHDDQHHPGDAVGDGVERLALEHRGVRSGRRQHGRERKRRRGQQVTVRRSGHVWNPSICAQDE